MNKFVFVGKVLKNEIKTYGKEGKGFLSLLVQNDKNKLEVACFGDNIGIADEVAKVGRTVKLQGSLESREYKDKNGVTRYGIQLRLDFDGAITAMNTPPPVSDEIGSIAF